MIEWRPEMIVSEQNNTQVRSIPFIALASLVCSFVATGWLRDFGDGFLSAPLVGLLLSFVGICAAVILASGRLGVPRIMQFLTVPFGCWLGVVTAANWIARLGAYAVPHVPDIVGAAVSVAAIATGVLSLVRREHTATIALIGLSLGLFVLVTSFLYDRVRNSPYYTLRQFAAAAYRNDQKAMMPFLSSASLRHFSELPTTYYGNDDGVYPRELKTVDHMHGIAARNTLLLGIKIKGNRAMVDCPVPQRWDLFRVAGKGGEVYLVREGKHWKVDAYRHWQETEKRFERNQRRSTTS